MALNVQNLGVLVPMANRPLPSLPEELSMSEFSNVKKQVTFKSTLTSLSLSLLSSPRNHQQNQKSQGQASESEAVQKNVRRVLRLTPRVNRNRSCYWDKPFITRVILTQTVAVAALFIFQCTILMKYGNPLFCMDVGHVIILWMPMIYILGVLHSLYTHVLPTYCKISIACVIQGVTTYSTLFLMTKDISDFIHPESDVLYFSEPHVLWFIIFMLTCYMSVTSLVLFLVSMHDVCYFRRIPISATTRNPVIRRYVVKNIYQMTNLQKQNEKPQHVNINVNDLVASTSSISNHDSIPASSGTKKNGAGQDLEMRENFYGEFNYI